MLAHLLQTSPNWADKMTAWSTLATGIVTFLLAIAAVAAALQVERQIKEARVQHREQLHGSLRPVAIVSYVESKVEGTPPTVRIKAKVRNVGSGAALSIGLRAWIRIPKNRWDKVEERISEIDAMKASINIDEPELKFRLSGVGPEEEPDSCFLNQERPLEAKDYPNDEAVLIYRIEFRDVFNNPYPKSKGLSHIEISEPGEDDTT
ncbi:MAG TPA: hypothetical protein VIP09_09460 [Dehalococcoidia bacterium]